MKTSRDVCMGLYHTCSSSFLQAGCSASGVAAAPSLLTVSSHHSVTLTGFVVQQGIEAANMRHTHEQQISTQALVALCPHGRGVLGLWIGGGPKRSFMPDRYKKCMQ